MYIHRAAILRIFITLLLSLVIIVFTVPIIVTYCQPIPGEFGGGGCGPRQINGTLYPILLTQSNHTIVNLTFYTVPQLLHTSLPPNTPTYKTTFYTDSVILILLTILISYGIVCFFDYFINKLHAKKGKKIQEKRVLKKHQKLSD